jgi:hypothetical protein
MSTLTRPEITASNSTALITSSIGRAAGFCFGIGTQLLFLWTVVYLFLFLRYCDGTEYAGWWWMDTFDGNGICRTAQPDPVSADTKKDSPKATERADGMRPLHGNMRDTIADVPVLGQFESCSLASDRHGGDCSIGLLLPVMGCVAV